MIIAPNCKKYKDLTNLKKLIGNSTILTGCRLDKFLRMHLIMKTFKVFNENAKH